VNPLSGLPTVPETAMPAAVREGSAQDKQDYSAALGFEQVLLKQVVSAIVPKDSELSDSPYASAVQDAFAQGLTAAGGIGLGAQLFETMQRTRA
jgi:Rod binding domain-containing protein